jgi:hypothetical protein
MSEYVRESAESSEWRTISYPSVGKEAGGDSEGAPVTAEGMDEGGEASDDGDEGENEGGYC